MSNIPSIVTSQWLEDRLTDTTLRIVDASWYLPGEDRDAASEFVAGHIPGAVFFDIDVICDRQTDLPHMAPDAALFARDVGALGIGDNDTIVVYDSAGIFSAARVWWLFRLMGIDRVAVLDGGLPKWAAEGRSIQSGAVAPTARSLTAVVHTAMVRNIKQVQRALEDPAIQIVDARPPLRFSGEGAEPRPELPSGHMPGARNVFFKSVLHSDGTMLDVDALRQVFAAAHIDLSLPIITSCGSGVTAAVLSLALDQLGHKAHSLYDGAWSEWAATSGCDVVVDQV